jgi:asparagine N-glycosylation enzyme membrane subunit Stt3
MYLKIKYLPLILTLAIEVPLFIYTSIFVTLIPVSTIFSPLFFIFNYLWIKSVSKSKIGYFIAIILLLILSIPIVFLF